MRWTSSCSVLVWGWCSSMNSSQCWLKASADSPSSTMASAVRPWVIALQEDACLPSGVLGPRDFAVDTGLEDFAFGGHRLVPAGTLARSGGGWTDRDGYVAGAVGERLGGN